MSLAVQACLREHAAELGVPGFRRAGVVLALPSLCPTWDHRYSSTIDGDVEELGSGLDQNDLSGQRQVTFLASKAFDLLTKGL